MIDKNYLTPAEIAEYTLQTGINKVNLAPSKQIFKLDTLSFHREY